MNEIEPELDMDCDVDFNMDRDIDVDINIGVRANSVDNLSKSSSIVIGSIKNSKNGAKKRQIFVDKALLVC